MRKWNRSDSSIPQEDLPQGRPKFWGYVTQQHNIRDTKSGMTKGWSILGDQVDKPVYKCNGAGGLTGEHISKARKSKELYQDIINTIEKLL